MEESIEESFDESVEMPSSRPLLNSSRPDGRSESDVASTEENSPPLGAFRIAITCLLLLTVIFVIYDSFGPGWIHASVIAFLTWVETHQAEGAMAVIGVYIIATVCFVPSTILTIGTGYAFGAASESKLRGVLVAFVVAFTGASLGTICTFLFGRYLFRDCVSQMASNYPMFKAIDRALTRNGLKIMILLRLSPIVPWNALDYMSGITAVPLWAYSAALVGSIPGTIMMCFLGASASSLTDTSSAKNKTMNIVTLVLGVIFAGGGVFVASYYSKLELDRILAEEEETTRISLPELPTNEEDEGEEETAQIQNVPYRDDEESSNSVV